MASQKIDQEICRQIDHSVKLYEKLQTFYKENELFDTILITGNNNCDKLKTHRIVLCAFSKYFMEIFHKNQFYTNSAHEHIIELKEIDISILKIIIEFMYTGSIVLDLQIIEKLLKTASLLQMTNLIDDCCKLIEKNIDFTNSLKWFRLAYELNLAALKIKSLECTCSNFEKISKENHEQLLLLNVNELKELLFNSNDILVGVFEEDVFLTVVAWINYDKLNREGLLLELLSLIRYWALTPKFIVKMRKSVCKTVESYELICSWLQWHFNLKKIEKIEKLAIVFPSNGKDNVMYSYNFKDKKWSFEMNIILPSPDECMASKILIDNKLIYVGGAAFQGVTNRVKCYDIDSKNWINFPVMKKKLINCQLADLNGYLCVFGEDNHGSNSLEVYNFTTDKWFEVEIPKTSLVSRIAGFNGVLYILDFENGFLHSYHVLTKKWTLRRVQKDSIVDYCFVATKIFLYVIGGITEDNILNIVKRYNLQNNSWCEMASSPFAGCFEGKLINNNIIICDWFDVAGYNIDTNTWKKFKLVSPIVWGLTLCSLAV
ncbi:kelch-like protein 4 isoform X1 [Episyrphus balteatus]|uniref:kelch-like protein 4 isoform X1 n=1 Tax=Episyrphus balteatus TaxID=286459 RepID=UPI0024869D61|nr:kelch-like protein 4 isoform X1 [Episyrphus balteatus]